MFIPVPPADVAIYYERLFAATAFIVGAIVGSFLNVCVYRMPLGLSVNEPRRSFCPHCKAQIAWYHNLPVLSWLLLHGRCANCGKPIAVRYPLVELLTAALFLMVWVFFRHAWPVVAPYWIFAALLIVATFIDFDHFIIPDEITIGGTAAGVLLSLAVPQLMGENSHALGLVWSLVGAAVGYATLRAVVEVGKLVFGKKRVVLPEAQDFTWTKLPDGQDASLAIGGENDLWSDFFSRDTDELLLRCERLTFSGQEHTDAELRCYYNRVVLRDKTYPLEQLDTFNGRLREYVFPREAMGLGDAKFIAAIGAFLGWRAVFFTIAAASMVGSVIGIGVLLLGPKARSLRLPFGPYLAFGALVWVFCGPQLVHWYLNLIQR